MKSRLAITALFVLSLLLVSTTAALATGSDKEQADKDKNAGKGDHWDKKHGDSDRKKHGDKKHGDKPKSAADAEYGHDEEHENDTLIPAKPGGGASEAGAGGAASAITVGDTTATAGAPGSTGAGGPSTLTPGAGLPGSPTAVTAPGAPEAGGPSTVTPGGGDTSGPGEGGLESSPQGGVAGNVASGGNEAAETPAGADVRSGEQVAAANGSGLAFTGFAAIPLLLVGLAVLTGGLLLRRGRATS